MNFSVETWDPSYGAPSEVSQADAASESVDLEVELEKENWKPITPEKPKDSVDSVIFIDGVRRYDAHVWFNSDGISHRGICATVAAGAVRCTNESAKVESVQVERAVHTSAELLAPLELKRISETYKAKLAKDDSSESLNFSVQNHMLRIEDLVSENYNDEQLVVYDGPLNQREHKAGVGYVKTQHVQYLPTELLSCLANLKPGQRTPVFHIIGRFDRWSWYLQLPTAVGPDASAIVRIELPDLGDVSDIVARANLVSQLIPKYSSEAHKESRAPQNLYPISGLERHLRNRLGDRDLLERNLRLASV